MKKNLSISLRPATHEDVDFIFALRVETMKVYLVDTFGWDDEEQYRAAADYLDRAWIVQIEGKPAGVIKVVPDKTEIRIHQLQIAGEYQGMGIGSALLKGVTDRADLLGIPVGLNVLKGSPAKRLYERLGFSVVEEREHNYRMIRNP